jgi:hypothetical protein
MKSTEDTTIAEFSPGDNRHVEMERQEPPQRAYLLRCCRERRGRAAWGSLWRFSLEEVLGDRRRRGFHSLEALVTFIRGELREAEAGPDEG